MALFSCPSNLPKDGKQHHWLDGANQVVRQGYSFQSRFTCAGDSIVKVMPDFDSSRAGVEDVLQVFKSMVVVQADAIWSDVLATCLLLL